MAMWNRTLAINLKGVWLCMGSELPFMLKSINAVCPGVIRTPMVDRLVKSHPEMESQLAAGTGSTLEWRTLAYDRGHGTGTLPKATVFQVRNTTGAAIPTPPAPTTVYQHGAAQAYTGTAAAGPQPRTAPVGRENDD